jgi:hypothetical protein
MPPGLDRSAASGRLATARAGRDLVTALRAARDPVGLVAVLARTPLPATAEAVGRSVSSAEEVTRSLDGFAWERLRPLAAAEDASPGAWRRVRCSTASAPR